MLACEPYPSNAAALRENLDLNDVPNVRVIEAALGSRPGTLGLARGGGDSGGVTALDWAKDGRVDVPMTPLDETAAGMAAVTLMKLDVEGWEAQVLSGASRTLLRTRSVLIEINAPALRKAGSSAEELFGLLRRSGFSTFMPLSQTGLRRLHRSDVTNVLAGR